MRNSFLPSQSLPVIALHCRSTNSHKSRKEHPRRHSLVYPNLSPPPKAAPQGKQVGVREVAHVAKVSVATVSLVINDNPRISQATQQRVRKVMEQLATQRLAFPQGGLRKAAEVSR